MKIVCCWFLGVSTPLYYILLWKNLTENGNKFNSPIAKTFSMIHHVFTLSPRCCIFQVARGMKRQEATTMI